MIGDDPTVRDMMERLLAKEGFSMATAASGVDGLRRARQVRPGAIPLDVLMPDVDGWTVLAALKGDPELARPRPTRSAATHCLVKPVDRDRLAQPLRRLCADRPSPRLLVVQDDETTRTVIEQALEREGWTITSAENGRGALARVAELRRQAGWCDIPVLVLSAMDLTDEDRRRLDGEVERVIERDPYGRDELLHEVGRLLAAAMKRPAARGTGTAP